MVKYWFTSDTHFEHDKIIEYVYRPFETIEEMNEALLNNINKKCKKTDVLYHLGDFYMATSVAKGRDTTKPLPAQWYIDQIRPQITFINGNHDSRKITHSYLQEAIIKVGKTYLFCSHEPRTELELNLCGHVHDMWRVVRINGDYIVNVGVDMWNYEPISFEQIKQAQQHHRHFFTPSPAALEHYEKLGRRPTVNERVWNNDK